MDESRHSLRELSCLRSWKIVRKPSYSANIKGTPPNNVNACLEAEALAQHTVLSQSFLTENLTGSSC